MPTSNPNFSDIVLCALRYAMGRKSYITSTVAYYIHDNWQHLDPRTHHNIHRDLKNFLLHNTDTSVISKIDNSIWCSLLEFIESQNNTQHDPA